MAHRFGYAKWAPLNSALGNMITRTIRATIADYLRYIKGGNPCDEWRFRVPGLSGSVHNEWRGGAKLFVDGVLVASTRQLIEVSGTVPIMLATIKDSGGTQRTIAIFARAFLTVKIRIEIDGKPLLGKFI